MGTALTKGDIDVMHPHHVARPDRRSSPSRADKGVELVESPAWRSATSPSTPTPRRSRTRPSARPWPSSSTAATRLQGLRLPGRAALLAGPGQRHRPLQLVLQQVRRPDAAKAASPAADAGITTPVKLTLHYTTDHYGPATAAGVRGCSRSSSTPAASSTSTSRAPPGPTFRPAEQQGRVRRLRHGLVPGLPRRRQLPRALPRQGQLPQLAVRQHARPRQADPASPGREADRLAAAGSLTEHPGHRRRRRARPAAVAGQAVRRRPRRHHRRRVRAQLLLRRFSSGSSAAASAADGPAS